MHVRFTNISTDSGSDTSPTRRIAFTFDGERYERTLSQRGTMTVPREVGEYLIESPDYAVVSDEDETDADADADDEDSAEADDEADDEDTEANSVVDGSEAVEE